MEEQERCPAMLQFTPFQFSCLSDAWIQLAVSGLECGNRGLTRIFHLDACGRGGFCSDFEDREGHNSADGDWEIFLSCFKYNMN